MNVDKLLHYTIKNDILSTAINPDMFTGELKKNTFTIKVDVDFLSMGGFDCILPLVPKVSHLQTPHNICLVCLFHTALQQSDRYLFNQFNMLTFYTHNQNSSL